MTAPPGPSPSLPLPADKRITSFQRKWHGLRPNFHWKGGHLCGTLLFEARFGGWLGKSKGRPFLRSTDLDTANAGYVESGVNIGGLDPGPFEDLSQPIYASNSTCALKKGSFPVKQSGGISYWICLFGGYLFVFKGFQKDTIILEASPQENILIGKPSRE